MPLLKNALEGAEPIVEPPAVDRAEGVERRGRQNCRSCLSKQYNGYGGRGNRRRG
jgi:hypothetical protein